MRCSDGFSPSVGRGEIPYVNRWIAKEEMQMVQFFPVVVVTRFWGIASASELWRASRFIQNERNAVSRFGAATASGDPSYSS